MKQLSFLILPFLCLIMSSCSVRNESSAPSPTIPKDAVEIGNSGYYCITGESEEVDAISSESTQRIKVFAHQIFDPNCNYVITLTTTISGQHSFEEDTAAITDLTASMSDAATDGFSASVHISKNTGTVILYRNQQSVCYFQYRLLPDGTFSFL